MTGILVRRDETDFPGGPVVGTSPASAGDVGDPGQGRLHELRSRRAHAPALLQPVPCSAAREAAAVRSWSAGGERPQLPAAREGPRASTETKIL